MKFRIFIVVLVASFMAIISSGDANASNDVISGWRGDSIQAFSSTETVSPRYDGMPCSGAEVTVRVAGGRVDDAGCVFGDVGQIRVARYVTAYGEFRYAISFPLDAVFYPIRGLCEGAFRCVYAPTTDTLLMSSLSFGVHFNTTMYRDFTQMLQKTTINGVVGFTFTAKGEGLVLGNGQVNFSTGTAAFSRNGAWAVVELRDYGVVLIDVKNGSFRRIIAPGATYGRGNDPAYELAVSNSGSLVAVTGIRLGLEVYVVDGVCGDTLDASSEYRFKPGVVPCRFSEIDRYALFPGFYAGRAPEFSGNEESLAASVQHDVGMRRVKIGPSSLRPVSSGAWYVAFGDSYTSGEGETADSLYLPGTNTAENKCHVSARSYPFLIGAHWQVESKNHACSGARINDIQADNGALPAQNTYVDHDSAELITIGIGGNDAGLITKLKACLGFDTCEWARPGNERAAASNEITRLFTPLVDLVQSIKSRAARATVALVGYPEIINESPQGVCDLLSASLFNSDERRFMGESIRYLNKTIQMAARASGALYLDIEDSLSGYRLCEGGQLGMNGVRLGDDIAPITQLAKLKVVGAESYHPTPYGHRLTASRIARNYDWGGLVGTKPEPHSGLTAPSPSQYWSEGASDAGVKKDLLNIEDLAVHSYVASQLSVAVPPRIFASNTSVTVELHSDLVSLGSSTTGSNGELHFTYNLPDTLPTGFHSVHILGTSVSGNPIDAYFSTFIEEQGSAEPDVVANNTSRTKLEVPENTKAVKSFVTTSLGGVTDAVVNSDITPANSSVLGILAPSQSTMKTFVDTNGATPLPYRKQAPANILACFLVLITGLIGVLIWLSLRKGRGG